MNKFPVVAHTFLIRTDSVLLIRRFNTGFEDGQYGPVGGHLEGHESIKQAAIRECQEEIGVKIHPTDLKIVGVTHYDSPTGEGIDFFLSTTKWAGEPMPCMECDEVRWFRFDKLPQNTIPFVCRAIEKHVRLGIWIDEIGLGE